MLFVMRIPPCRTAGCFFESEVKSMKTIFKNAKVYENGNFVCKDFSTDLGITVSNLNNLFIFLFNFMILSQ